jgi:hypothetical protein
VHKPNVDGNTLCFAIREWLVATPPGFAIPTFSSRLIIKDIRWSTDYLTLPQKGTLQVKSQREDCHKVITDWTPSHSFWQASGEFDLTNAYCPTG